MVTTIHQPLISIVLPVRNAEQYLSACLQSLLRQSYANFEIIVIDDKSTDKSLTILKEFRRKDTRIKLFQNVKRYGSVVTLNRALKKTKGDIIAFMKAEDISNKYRLQKQVKFLLSNQKAVGVGSQCMYLDERSEVVGKSMFPTDSKNIYRKPLHTISLQFESFMIHRNRIPKDLLKFHTERVPYIYSDILVKLMQYGELFNLSDILYTHRKFHNEKKQTQGKILAKLMKHWTKAETIFRYKPSLSNSLSFLFPVKTA